MASGVEASLQRSRLEQARAGRFLARVSWAVVGVLGALAASMWIAPFADTAGYHTLVRLLGVGALFEILALIGLVVALRHRLVTEVRRVGEALEAVAQQYVLLQAQHVELEHANDDLRDTQKSERVLIAEAELLTRRLTEAQQVAQLAYFEIDAATGTVYWSDEMYRLAGLEVGITPPPTDRFLEAVHLDDRQRMQDVAAAALRDLTEFTEVYRITAPGGPTRTMQAKGRVVVNERGERRLVGTLLDISDRVQMEIQLRRSQKMDAIGQLAGGVAHDFNNVLTVIEGYSSLLLTGRPAADPDRASIEQIREAARRAAGLTRQLLAFSRQQVLQPRVLNMNDAIGGVETMLRRLIGEHLEFHTKLSPSLGRVKADPTQLEQVLMNLAVNARDAMVNGGILTIETANATLDETYARRYPSVRPGAYVMLAVSDTGTGIAQADIERIFEPFFTTKESGKGTGLGLATVQGIVEQSGGHVNVYSEMGRGTTFRVYLPRVEEEDRALDPTTPEGAARHGKETILLVEDDDAVRGVAAAILRRAGYTVIETSNGIQALQLCQDPSVAFDLVLTDAIMPGLGGRALLGHVQRVRPGVPVLLMSGYTRDAMVNSAELPASGMFVQKPFTPAALTQKVREAMDRGHL